MMQKSLDVKIARILADPSCKDFILADAKDADMAAGLNATGFNPGATKPRSLAEYRQMMRDIVAQGLVDIMLMSASTSEVLTLDERLFDHSHITPAIRANDTTDIWLAGCEGQYAAQPARPFRSASLKHVTAAGRGVNLGLYSITFNNDRDHDLEALQAYKAFRDEAEPLGFRHFLELFDPNKPQGPIENVGRFLNDHIARTLAGVTRAQRPVFLKIPYHGPAAMEALASYDRTLIPGILGGSSGTTFDAFFQLWEARKYGARVALYGRKINNSEHQLTFITYLRAIADGNINDPAEAVRAYHNDLAKLNITPYRKLDDDLQKSDTASAYGATSTRRGDLSPPASTTPMSLARQRERLDRLYGR